MQQPPFPSLIQVWALHSDRVAITVEGSMRSGFLLPERSRRRDSNFRRGGAAGITRTPNRICRHPGSVQKCERSQQTQPSQGGAMDAPGEYGQEQGNKHQAEQNESLVEPP